MHANEDKTDLTVDIALQGRPLRQGDLIPLGAANGKSAKSGLEVPQTWRATFAEKGKTWQVGVLPGPNADPDYFTPEDIATFYSSAYKVHYNSCADSLQMLIFTA